jgi:cytochrome c oxidase assembly protein subunit 11
MMTNIQQNVRNMSARKHWRVALPLVLVVAGMTGLSFASVPLYRLFCATTGYGGTTQRVAAPSGAVGEETITVRFDANTSAALKWDFQPEQREITLKVGENSLAFYRAVNRSNTPLTGSATFNVTPEIAGSYFNKVECFCFTEQTLAPGQSADFPVSFFVDPAILADPDAKNLKEITLSYTFFRVNKDGESASSPPKGAASRSLEKGGSSG